MLQRRCILGIGEAIWCEYPERAEPGGIAVAIARHAKQIGATGIAVSRLGQDLAANELLTQLKAWGLPIDHLQSDPDLPTGRMVIRSIAGTTRTTLQPRAAFDNLQWDFDLVDIAQQADAVVFGMLAQRVGQSQSIIRRFLAECTNAVRVFDLTNRESDAIDRVQARTSLNSAEGLIADDAGLRALVPSWDGKNPSDAASEIIRDTQLAFVISISRTGSNEAMTVHTASEVKSAAKSFAASSHDAAVVGFLHGMLRGWDVGKSIDAAAAIANHAHEHGDDPVPETLV